MLFHRDEQCSLTWRRLQLWDLKTQEVMQTYNISASAVTSVAFSGYKDEYIVGGSARYDCHLHVHRQFVSKPGRGCSAVGQFLYAMSKQRRQRDFLQWIQLTGYA